MVSISSSSSDARGVVSLSSLAFPLASLSWSNADRRPLFFGWSSLVLPGISSFVDLICRRESVVSCLGLSTDALRVRVIAASSPARGACAADRYES